MFKYNLKNLLLYIQPLMGATQTLIPEIDGVNAQGQNTSSLTNIVGDKRGPWAIIDDGVMGGKSRSKFDVKDNYVVWSG